jgi:capsular polysaccharide transport system permease protein
MYRVLTVQGRVLWALMLREMATRFGTLRAGYVFALVEPASQVIVLYIVHLAIVTPTPHFIPMFIFFITGVLPWSTFSGTVRRVQGAVAANQALLMYPQVSGLDVVLGRAIVEIATMTAVLAIMAGLALVIEGGTLPQDPLMAIVVFWSAWLLGTSLGLILTVLDQFLPTLSRLLNFVLAFGFFLSGVFFTADQIPSNALPYLLWNPMLHINEMMRSAWFTVYDSQVADPVFVAITITAMLMLGLAGERLLRRYAPE